jgi:hypothetical protein
MTDERAKVTADVIKAAMALAQRDVDLGLITIEEIESIPKTRFAPIERKKIAEALKAQGMSNRAIAKTIGASHQTIARDIAGPDGPPEGEHPKMVEVYVRPVEQPPHEPVKVYARFDNGGDPSLTASERMKEYAALEQQNDDAAAPATAAPGPWRSRKRKPRPNTPAEKIDYFVDCLEGSVSTLVNQLSAAQGLVLLDRIEQEINRIRREINLDEAEAEVNALKGEIDEPETTAA